MERAKKRRRPMPYERKKRIYGYGFISLWFIGIVFYFIRPLAEALRFTIGRIVMLDDGYAVIFQGLRNYIYVLREDPNFIQMFTGSLLALIYEIPVILVFAMIFAVILNQKFRGRTVMRAIFFVPVIIASGVIINIITGDPKSTEIIQGGATSALLQANNMTGYLYQLGLPYQIIDPIIMASNNIINFAWKAGIQILIMLAGLQTIPSELYEASAIEGASGWENFWKITFPMVSPMMVLVIVFTIINSFTDYNNPLMSTIHQKARTGQIELSATMSVIYSVCVLAVVGVIYAFVNRLVVYREKE